MECLVIHCTFLFTLTKYTLDSSKFKTDNQLRVKKNNNPKVMLFIIKLTKGEVSRFSVARLVLDVNRMDHKAGHHLFSVPFKETTPLCPGAQGVNGDHRRSLICNLLQFTNTSCLCGVCVCRRRPLDTALRGYSVQQNT